MGCDSRAVGDAECPETSMKCPENTTNATVCMSGSYLAFCESDGCTGNRMANCADRCVVYDNENTLPRFPANDISEPTLRLSKYPPYTVHVNATCWEEYPGAWNAQCTDDCVPVTMLNGTETYPAVSSRSHSFLIQQSPTRESSILIRLFKGCSFASASASSQPTSTSISVSLYPSQTTDTSASTPSASPSTNAGKGSKQKYESNERLGLVVQIIVVISATCCVV